MAAEDEVDVALQVADRVSEAGEHEHLAVIMSSPFGIGLGSDAKRGCASGR